MTAAREPETSRRGNRWGETSKPQVESGRRQRGMEGRGGGHPAGVGRMGLT